MSCSPYKAVQVMWIVLTPSFHTTRFPQNALRISLVCTVKSEFLIARFPYNTVRTYGVIGGLIVSQRIEFNYSVWYNKSTRKNIIFRDCIFEIDICQQTLFAKCKQNFVIFCKWFTKFFNVVRKLRDPEKNKLKRT